MADEELRKLFAENLRNHLKRNDRSQADLARHMNVSTATAAKWSTGQTMPRIDKIQSICDWLGVSKSDLLEARNIEEKAIRFPHFIRLPVLGRVAGGVPIEQIEDIEGYEDFQAPTSMEKEYFALRVRGDSMQPLILDGSVVIVHKQPDAETGEIVIATINGDDATCKRLKKYADGIMLVSVNPAYDPIVLKKDDVDNEPVRILGKVVEVRTTL